MPAPQPASKRNETESRNMHLEVAVTQSASSGSRLGISDAHVSSLPDSVLIFCITMMQFFLLLYEYDAILPNMSIRTAKIPDRILSV